ncbi:hypothetical protein HanPI659440_Chr13g0515681 [Helianthus annuus]|nr:hypothetical protein HanPI659440_Chr13g0515681 [Helianthus annuus]
MTSFGVEPGELMGKAGPGQEHDTRFRGILFTRKHGEMTPIIGREGGCVQRSYERYFNENNCVVFNPSNAYHFSEMFYCFNYVFFF